MSLRSLVDEIRACTACSEHLPLGPRPIVSLPPQARLMIIGQAPGRRVHESGVPWDDPSGKRLREWLGIDRAEFYGEGVALMPMGFCYPGTGSSGDLPPRPECAALWHDRVHPLLPGIQLTLLLSNHAQRAYLGSRMKSNLTKTVEAWREYLPEFMPLPHPSPRNNRWLKNNPWFEADVLPELRERISRLFSA